MIALVTSHPGKVVCAVLLLGGMGICFYSFVLFDRLVRIYYRSYRAEWERDGSPRGYFWWAPDSYNIGSWLARNRLTFVWNFRTPPWITASSEHSALLRTYRICNRLFLIVWLILLIVAVSSR